MFETGCTLNLQRQFASGGERIDMAAAARQPAVQPVANGSDVGHADVERALRLDDAADLLKCAGQIIEMFEAVVGDNQVKAAIAEGEAGGVGLGEVRKRENGGFEIDSDHRESGAVRAKTAGVAPEVENDGARRKSLQQFGHA